jgi:NAD dependent epimerase/dehydratase family enzyme
MDDAIGAVHHALMTAGLDGPVNLTSPEPVTGRVLADTLGRVLRRPALAAAPAPVLRVIFGEMADAALLASQRALPARLTASGYGFRLPTLESALRHLLGR